MGSPWQSPGTQAPQGHWQSGAPSSPPSHTPVPPPHQPRRWGLITTVVVINVVAVSATAAITYALSNHDGPPASSTPSSPAPVKTYSAAEQGTVKEKVCQAFDRNSAGTRGQGGFIKNGEVNIPVVLRALNSGVAVQEALSPAASSDLTSAAKHYVSATLDLTSAALAGASVDDINRLNGEGNTATYALADVCGLPR